MKELFNIEPHSTGPGFLMRLKTGEIDVPDDRGGYIISSGCGSGKTESIKSLIRNKYNEGILYCVDTREELDKMYRWIIDNLVDVMPGLKKEDVMIISSDDEHYISLSEYKDNPEIIMQKKILLITHVRFWTDLINFFLIYKPISGVDVFDGDFRKLMTRDDLRGYIVFDETPTFIKPFAVFSPVMMGNFIKMDNNGEIVCKSESEIRLFYNKFIKDTPSDIFNHKYRIGRIKKEVALNMIPRKISSWLKSENKNFEISFYPIDLCFKDITIGTHILIFEGVGDVLFKGADNYKLLDTAAKYNTKTTFTKLDLCLKRNRIDEDMFSKTMDELKKIITVPTLIVSWKDVNREKTEPGCSLFRRKIMDELTIRNIDSRLFYVTYYGANDNKSTNSFRDFKQVILLGDWSLPNTESAKIRRAFGTGTEIEDLKDWYFVQLISRIGIRKHIEGDTYSVFYTSDFGDEFIERLSSYINDNVITNKSVSPINDWEKIIDSMKFRKNIKEEIKKLVMNDKELQEAIVCRKDYSINVTFDYLEGIGIKRNSRERRNYKVLTDNLMLLNVCMVIS